MFVPLKIVTEYSLLKSTIKVDSLILFLKKHNITSCAICDENLYGVMEFFTKMTANHLKPIIGLQIKIEEKEIDLYPKNNEGYKNLLKIHTLKEINELTFDTLKEYLANIKVVLPRNSYDLLEVFPNSYLSYKNDTEKIEALLKAGHSKSEIAAQLHVHRSSQLHACAPKSNKCLLLYPFKTI